ncbi:MAG: hypothetical protein ACLQBB_15450 [Solirubrobacteraceae bacterium]
MAASYVQVDFESGPTKAWERTGTDAWQETDPVSRLSQGPTVTTAEVLEAVLEAIES